MEDKHMNKKNILLASGLAAVGLGLIALPGTSKAFQDASAAPQEVAPPAAAAPPRAVTRMRIMRAPQAGVLVGEMDGQDDRNMAFAFAEDGGSWLGVETQEVTADKVKELKLSAERGVLVGKVLEDSPAAKSGLKDGDVVTEIN
jgi:hypothetical protein